MSLSVLIECHTLKRGSESTLKLAYQSWHLMGTIEHYQKECCSAPLLNHELQCLPLSSINIPSTQQLHWALCAAAAHQP